VLNPARRGGSAIGLAVIAQRRQQVEGVRQHVEKERVLGAHTAPELSASLPPRTLKGPIAA